MPKASRPPGSARSDDRATGTNGRTGRRPGKSTTREEILDAARARFARLGYEKTSIRGIAAQAAVDPTLVLRFYESKERLFQEAIGWPFPPEEVIARLAGGDPAQLGERIARFVVDVWEQDGGQRIVALVRAASANEDAARALGEFLTHGIITPAAAALGAEVTPLRTAVVSAQLIGILFARYILATGPLAAATADELADVLAPELQELLAPNA